MKLSNYSTEYLFDFSLQKLSGKPEVAGTSMTFYIHVVSSSTPENRTVMEYWALEDEVTRSANDSEGPDYCDNDTAIPEPWIQPTSMCMLWVIHEDTWLHRRGAVLRSTAPPRRLNRL